MDPTLFFGAVILGPLVFGGGLYLLLSPRRPKKGAPRGYLPANAGVLRDDAHDRLHLRARRGDRLLDAFRSGEDVELYVDLDVDPAVTVNLLKDLDDPVPGLVATRFDLGQRRLVLAGSAPAEEATDFEPIFDFLAPFAADLEERFAVVPCESCHVRAFRHRAGPLLESVCSACRRRFFPPASAKKLFAELGLDVASLKETRTDERLPDRCPGCEHRMSRAHVEDVELELCPGCGAMWLDEGELDRLSGGRYREG
jgi:hypothetical protein